MGHQSSSSPWFTEKVHPFLSTSDDSDMPYNEAQLDEELEEIKKSQEQHNQKSTLFRNDRLTKEEKFPNIVYSFANSDSRIRFKNLVHEFQQKYNIEEDLYAHFEALKRFESGTWTIDMFLMGNDFDFGDEDNLTQYLRVLSLLHGTHNNEVNQDEALSILRELEKKNYAPALETLAILSYDDDNELVSVEYHKRGAEGGFLESYLNYGAHLLENPFLEEPNTMSGLEYLIQAANAESLAAMEHLVRSFYYGALGVAGDFDLTYAWAKTAMEYGSIEGAGYVGLCEIQGLGTKRNIKRGRSLVEKACDVGMLDIMGQFSILLLKVFNEPKRSLQLMEQYVASGSCIPEFYFNLATMYLSGRGEGTLKDIMHLLYKGAEYKDTSSLKALATFFENGISIGADTLEPNFEESVNYHVQNTRYCQSIASYNKLIEWKAQGKTNVDIGQIMEQQVEDGIAAFKRKLESGGTEEDRQNYEELFEMMREHMRIFKEGAKTAEEMHRVSGKLQQKGGKALFSTADIEKWTADLQK